MSQLIQHYQTSFSIRGGALSGEEKLGLAQDRIATWIRTHEHKRYVDLGRNRKTSFFMASNFATKANYRSTYSWCKTNSCTTENSIAWAVEYTHRDSEVRDIFWVSEIGLRCFPEEKSLVVFVKLSYKITSNFALTGESYLPDATIPWLVEDILKNFKGCQFFSGEKNVTECIGTAVRVNTPEIAKDILTYLRDPDRKLGVALLVGETKEILTEADFLSKNLFAKALVYVVPYNFKIRSYFKKWNLEFNECVFIPNFLVFDKSLSQALRYPATDSKTIEKHHSIILKAWLGVHPINERGAVSSLDNVEYLRRHEKLSALEEAIKTYVPADEYARIKQELQDVSGLFDLSEQEKSKLVDEKKKLKGQVAELEDKVLNSEIQREEQETAHKTELFNIQSAHAAEQRKSISNDGMLPREYPDSFHNLKLYAPFFRHLAFAPKAWDPAFEYEQFRDFGVAWGMLHDMDQVLWKLIFEEEGDIERKFEERTHFGYAKGEGTQTTKDPKMAAKRRFVFDGKAWEMWAHIKYHNTPGRQLRIHGCSKTLSPD